MQFIAHGPDIPDVLLQAHEEGRVVFFCGAGISYPAGLPNFKGLVDDIYKRLGTTFFPSEEESYKKERYDATLDLLERRFPGQRIAVRHALAKALQPKNRRKGTTDPHAALLQLSRNRDGSLRLVTTNFDRIFEREMKRSRQHSFTYSAPTLPVPKSSRWNGLVYLHGLLPAKTDENALQRLVVTSGDFGLAYLTERWAARFVSELFRNYVVCFVGYSINDPVLRYMMDALAADRMQGEFSPKAYALGASNPGEEQDKIIEWEAKGVVPILYEVPNGSADHSALYSTLKTWAEIHRDGVHGRERIVVDYALSRPSASTRQDEYVGRMLWALSDETGLPARLFADFNPVPPLEWLEAFSEDRYHKDDLRRFGVHTGTDQYDKLRFSLIKRPVPYWQAPPMMFVSGGFIDSQWDNVMTQLARWLLRHLNDPKLILWLAEGGGQLHFHLSWLIEHQLAYLGQLQQEGKIQELNEIRAQAPNAIPGLLMQPLWRLLLAGRVKSPGHNRDIYEWKEKFERDGLTTSVRIELRELLAPKIVLRKPFRWETGAESTEEPTSIKQIVNWELKLTTDQIRTTIQNLNNEHWRKVLPELLNDFQQLLLDALGLMRELGEANQLNDESHWYLPSVNPHWQNQGFGEWTLLIELLRDAWLATRNLNPAHAARVAQGWFDLPYPTFKRLALFAASKDGCIASGFWAKWLLADNSWWLWSINTQRETMRLLVLQGRHLKPRMQGRLEKAILAGPPRNMYKSNLKPEDWHYRVTRTVWIRLAKLDASGLILGMGAKKRLDTLSLENPKWKLEVNERDEFSHWMSGTGDQEFEEKREIIIAPRNSLELVKWLKKPIPESHSLYEDNWLDTCRSEFTVCLIALRELAQEGIWPIPRWQEALQAWSEKELALRSGRYALQLIQTMPDSVLLELVQAVTWWLEMTSEVIDRHDDIFLNLCNRVLVLPLDPDTGITQNGKPLDQLVTDAINHPIGRITQALLNLWFKRKPNDNDRLPTDIEPFFTQLCNPKIDRFRHGRVLLASRLIAIFRVDPPWTEKQLLPMFDWKAFPVEAKEVWNGFLWSPRLHQPLLRMIKYQFLETARHFGELGELGRKFAAFLTYAALEHLDGFSADDFRIAFEELPQEGLLEATQALSQAIDGAGDQREEYWRNRIQPFWQNVWPKSLDLLTDRIAESLTRLVLSTGNEFPLALTTVYDWLQPLEHTRYSVHRLLESGFCENYPKDVLRLLNKVIDGQPWGSPELSQCLKLIIQASPELEQDSRYKKLEIYARQHDRKLLN